MSDAALVATFNGIQFGITQDFAWVVLASIVMAVQMQAIGYSVLPGRFRAFAPTKFQTGKGADLNEEHKKAFGKNIWESGDIGYPDSGSGRLSAVMTYKEWYTFACSMRAHENYRESMPLYQVLLVWTGLFFPRLAAGCAVGLMACRAVYTGGYKMKGPKGRELGRNFSVLFLACLLLTALYSTLRMSGLVGPIVMGI